MNNARFFNILSESTKKKLSKADLEFFSRIWRTDIKIYESRLRAVKIFGLNSVLDAGCGFGQWSIPMAKLNKFVYSIDSSEGRICALNDLISYLKIDNVCTMIQNIENLDFEDESFDAIFCYSVICFLDHRLALKEFFRVLKPGGLLYLCTNGLGWYLHNLIDLHNSSENFDSREMSINTIKNTIDFLYYGIKSEKGQLCVPSYIMIKEIENMKFRIKAFGPEGSINFSDAPIVPFFKSDYYGQEGVYEILAEKFV